MSRQRILLNDKNIREGWVDVETSTRIKQARQISIRLNRKNAVEADALRVLESLESPECSPRAIIADALAQYGGKAPRPINATVKVDSEAFAHEVEQMRADFNQQIATLSDTIVAMFETMKKTGFSIDIETPEKPVENREFANNIASAFMNRYGG